MARLTIDEGALIAMGDALRVHFGENISEGEQLHWDSSPRVLAANYDEYGTGAKEYAGYLKPECYVKTYQIHGAARLKLDISYRTEGADFLWVAEGAHKLVCSNVGQRLQYKAYGGVLTCPECDKTNIEGTGIWREVGNDNLGNYMEELKVCKDCGLMGYEYSGSPFDIADDGRGYSTVFVSSGPLLRTTETINFEGDTFTFACVTYAEEAHYTGYYGYLYAYDADGNEITSYDMTFGRVPNTYAPYEIIRAIGELNNYPDAEEVPF